MKSIIALIAIIVLLGGGYIYLKVDSVETVEITVNDKERVVKPGGKDKRGSSKYLIYTEGEVFENTDAFFYWKHNSSDVQGQLHQDSTYTVKVEGWRVPFLSMYRNILKVEQ